MPAIDLPPRDLDVVLRLLAEHAPDREVWAFGSRVAGNAKPFSDLDLAILGEPLTADALDKLQDAFRESDLSFKVDVIEWSDTQEHFRRIVERQHVVLHKSRQ